MAAARERRAIYRVKVAPAAGAKRGWRRLSVEVIVLLALVCLDVLAFWFGRDSRDDLWTDERRREWRRSLTVD